MRTVDMLRELPNLAAEVYLTIGHPNPTGPRSEIRGSSYGAKVPIDCVAYDALRPDDHGQLAILTLCVRLVAEELRDAGQTWPALVNPPTWVAECDWLIGTEPWWSRQPWAEDIDRDVTAVWKTLGRAARVTPPLRLTCTQCSFPVYPEADGSYYRCEAGHTIMLKPELERLGKIQEYTSAELAELMGITDRTLRRWKAAGIIAPVGKLGKQDTYSVLDVQRAREKVRA
ncbi:MAG: MerR family transcriptional regulator [Chitinophagaceae bacterium]|nr:MerR family transcriptional regulator [Rubrivivax sp.]